jgi:hypothetical protein
MDRLNVALLMGIPEDKAKSLNISKANSIIEGKKWQTQTSPNGTGKK